MKKIIILALTLFALFAMANANPPDPPINEQDSLALVALYNSTNGASWTDNTNWLTAERVADWNGITVSFDRVTGLSLNSNNLDGTIPTEIGNLTALIDIQFFNNKLTGPIPGSIGNMMSLTNIYFSSNDLSGDLPAEIWNLTNLTSLNIGSNDFTGELPAAIGNLINLGSIVLSGCQFTGPLPVEIADMISLQYLYMERNKFSGPIPSLLGDLTNIEQITLRQNRLTGNVPASILNNSNIKVLSLSINRLSGVFPDFSLMTGLTELSIDNNIFTGTLSSDMQALTNLNWFNISYNSLSGAIPWQYDNLVSLRNFRLNNNQFTDFPDLTALEGTLQDLRIHDNKFTFEDIEPNIGLPEETFGYAPQDSAGSPLDTTADRGSSFTLTASVGGANNIYQWYKNGGLMDGENDSILVFDPIENSDAAAYTCEITNSVATELTLTTYTMNVDVEDLLQADSLALVALYNSTDGPNWTDKTNWLSAEPLNNWYGITITNNRVSSVQLYTNNLVGSIPTDIGDLTSLQQLNLGENQLSGTIPPEVFTLTGLTNLSLYWNQLTGSIPASISNLTKLTGLFLYNNQLAGPITESIGELTKLNSILLHNNQLSGPIPESIGNLTVLYTFYLYNNQLTGSVPSTILNILHLDDFQMQNNKLDELPNLISLTDMTKLKMENNRFTFADIEPQIYIGTFTYSPQANMGTPVDTTIETGSSFTMEFDAGGTVTNYQWYKDAAIIDGATNSTLALSPVAFSDAGTYTCVITNDLATDLTLNTLPIEISVVKSFFEVDSLALVDLYNSTNGSSWDTTMNWLTAAPLENWFGITVSDGRVTQIQLSNNNVAGSIPASLYDMSALETLAIRHHQLTGSISPDIGKLTNLNFLDLAFGQLSGAIPDELGNCTELTLVVIDYNAFTGTIPQSLGNLKKLDALYLGGNHLTGTIPDSLCTLPLLRTFHLHENQLTGPIPAAIGNLDSLASLRFEANQLSGTIPESIVNLKKLTHLWIQTNQITGAVPTAITGMDSLKSFKIFDNQFSDFPDVSSMVPQLKWVRIWDNKFTFEDIEPNVDAGLLEFNYTPQDSIGEVVDSTITEGDDLTISVSVGGTVNQYQWMKDGTDISGATSSSYMISSAVIDDAGTYVCKITNTIATELTLYSSNYNVTVDPQSGIEDNENGIPKSYALYQNYPNPFNPTTTIRYDLPKASAVKVHIYNVLGNRVKTVVSGVQTAGRKSVVWNGRDESGIQVASGIYFYQITATRFNKTMKMLMVK